MRNFRLALALAVITVMALGASAFASHNDQPDVPGDLGPDDTKVLVYDKDNDGDSDAAIMWTAEPPQMGTITYTVYRAYVGTLMNNMPLNYAFLFTEQPLQCTVDTNGNLVNSPNCTKDPLYGYIRIVDQNLTNYEEYNYLVKSSADDVADPNQALNDYVVVRAFPPTQTRHGNYTEYTNACTACHGLHSSNSIRLLKGPSITDLCITCHDGTGSKYDEVRGKVRIGPSWSNSAYAAAGPFGDALKGGSGVTTTSVHNV
ncbi:MAG: cytochrome c3 family protein, partial [bacterium]